MGGGGIWPLSFFLHLFFFSLFSSFFLHCYYSQAPSFLHFLFLHTTSCLENNFSRLTNLIFIISLKIYLDLWVFGIFEKTYFFGNPLFKSPSFCLPWPFLLSYLGFTHFMGRDMIHQLSGMLRRDFFKTYLRMLHTLPPRISRWVHFLFSLVNLLIFAWYLRNLWWALSFCYYLLFWEFLDVVWFGWKIIVSRHVDLLGHFWVLKLFEIIKLNGEVMLTPYDFSIITSLKLGGERIEGHVTISLTELKNYLGVNPPRVSGSNISLMWLFYNIEKCKSVETGT